MCYNLTFCGAIKQRYGGSESSPSSGTRYYILGIIPRDAVSKFFPAGIDSDPKSPP